MSRGCGGLATVGSNLNYGQGVICAELSSGSWMKHAMPGEFMKAYACVYRHVIPSRRERRLTEQAATDIPLVRKYLDRYDEPDCFDDWGDDPSFFSATGTS